MDICETQLPLAGFYSITNPSFKYKEITGNLIISFASNVIGQCCDASKADKISLLISVTDWGYASLELCGGTN